MEPILELFEKRKKAKEEAGRRDFSNVDKIISRSEFKACEKEFNDVFNYAKDVIKKEFDGLVVNPEPDVKTVQGKNGIFEYTHTIFLVNIKENFDKFQKTTRNKHLVGVEFDDADGEYLSKELENRLLKPFKSKGFKFEDHGYSVMEKEHENMEDFVVYINDDYENMLMKMKVYVQETVSESTVPT